MENLYNKNGISVRALKELIKDWPEEDVFGGETDVWITTSEGLSSICTSAIRLNYRKDGDKETADLLLVPSNYDGD